MAALGSLVHLCSGSFHAEKHWLFQKKKNAISPRSITGVQAVTNQHHAALWDIFNWLRSRFCGTPGMAVKWHVEERAELFLVCVDLLQRLWQNTLHPQKRRLWSWKDFNTKQTCWSLIIEDFKAQISAESDVRLEVEGEYKESGHLRDNFQLNSWQRGASDCDFNSEWACMLMAFLSEGPFELACAFYFTFCWCCNPSDLLCRFHPSVHIFQH